MATCGKPEGGDLLQKMRTILCCLQCNAVARDFFIVDLEIEVKAGISYPALLHCMSIKSDVVGVTKMSARTSLFYCLLEWLRCDDDVTFH